jgi:hypothetical protein
MTELGYFHDKFCLVSMPLYSPKYLEGVSSQVRSIEKSQDSSSLAPALFNSGLLRMTG